MERYQEPQSQTSRRSSFQTRVVVGEREKGMMSIGIFGGLLMFSGLAAAVLGFSGIGGLILILLGALAIAAAVIISYQMKREYSPIPSVSANISDETPPSVPVDQLQRSNTPSWASTSESGQLVYNSRDSSPYTAPSAPHPSAPPINYRENDNPPSYEELFNNRS